MMKNKPQLNGQNNKAKETLRRIRNFMAGQVVGFTRDEALLEEILKCTYCRVFLERKEIANDFQALIDTEAIAKQYRQAFSQIRNRYPSLFNVDDELLLAPNHIAYIDQELAALELSKTAHDIIGDIYETFIGSAYRGQEGQFFTPSVAIDTLIQMTDPTAKDLIIDPACGSGSFIIGAARHIANNNTKVNINNIHGIDKDKYLTHLSQLNLALQFDDLFPINCSDSLLWSGNDFENSPTKDLFGKFSLVLTNPPFGSKIVAVSKENRSRFELAHKWKYSKSDNRHIKTNAFSKNPSPQVLFIERSISLLKPGGRLGIVVPESVLSNPKYRYVVQYILGITSPVAIIGMPESLFKTSGRGGTHTKVCLVVLEKNGIDNTSSIFMAEAKWCGHDSRGRDIPKNDLPKIVQKYKDYKAGKLIKANRFGFIVPLSDVRENILAPRFYDPEPIQKLRSLEKTHNLVPISQLVKENQISFSTGDEIGKLAYGTGEIPFVRTSDISNWEIKIDPKHTVSEDIFLKYSSKQDVREGDVLMVRDGTYLIGTCAFISRFDTKIIYQSHMYKIRVHDTSSIDSYLLLALLSSPPVVSQIKAMSFTHDIINSLGNRIVDIVLPIPKSKNRRTEISEMVRGALESRIDARELTRNARIAVVS